jgi:hypothetical protein
MSSIATRHESVLRHTFEMTRRWLAISVLLAFSGCVVKPSNGYTSGQHNNLWFYEPNDYPDEYWYAPWDLEMPIVVGGVVDVAIGMNVQLAGCVLVGGETDNPDVLRVLDMTFNAFDLVVIRLLATGEGQTKLRVRASCPAMLTELNDSIQLTTLVADDVDLFHIDQPFSSLGFDEAEINPPHYIAAVPMRGGQPLLGFDAFDWFVDEEIIDFEMAYGEVNTYDVTCDGVAGETVLSTHLGGQMTITCQEEPGVYCDEYGVADCPEDEETYCDPYVEDDCPEESEVGM